MPSREEDAYEDMLHSMTDHRRLDFLAAEVKNLKARIDQIENREYLPGQLKPLETARKD